MDVKIQHKEHAVQLARDSITNSILPTISYIPLKTIVPFQNLLAIGGVSVMYKVQVLGPQNVLHKYEPFLLNPPVCMLLYILACVIMTASSCVVYMYGYHKFMAFLETEREKRSVVLREAAATSLWAYFPHCSAMCVLIALAVCFGPLLYDFTLVYKVGGNFTLS
jgi:hypothetical protein